MDEQKMSTRIGVKSRVLNGLARQKTRLKCLSVSYYAQILQFYDPLMTIYD